MKHVDAKAGTITFDDEDGTETTLPVTGGQVKLQWKPDFGMRWAALGVDFEMFGKDHQTNAVIYDRICNILGGRAPEHFVYELFLDENGQKISKSKGNGLTIDEWLTYAPTESLGALHVPAAAAGQEALFRRHPAGGRRVLSPSSPPIRARTGRSGSATRSGTSMTASRRRSTCRCRSRCCSTSSAPPTRRTRTCCGASSRATRRA